MAYGKGRLTGMSDPSGTTAYHYDAIGRLAGEERTIQGVVYTISYAYDNVGNLTSLTYPSGRVVTYNHDALGRVTSVAATKGQSITLANVFVYDNVGNLSSVSLGNGLVSSETYDSANRVATMIVPGVVNMSYAYDNVGNVAGITDGLRPSSTKTYAYDPLDRLAQATGPWNLLSYTYDANGNRLSQQNGPVTTYTYQTNRLSTITNGGVTTYQHDFAGNITSDGSKEFTYDQNQRLIGVLQGSNVVGEYFYNGIGRRAIKVSNGTNTTVFHYDMQGRLIGESDATGALITEYVWVGDRPLAMVRRSGVNEEMYYFHADHLNTPLKVTDQTGAVVWDVEFDPFGNELAGGVKSVENSLRFPGQYFDAETGLHQNYFRDYDPKTGRYIQADPIGLKGGINIYTYVGDNPLSNVDFNGLTQTQCEKGCPSGRWSGAGLNIGGMLFSGGVFTGTYRVQCWGTGKTCWIIVSCAGSGLGLGGSLSAESIWISGAYNSSDLGGSAEGAVGFGGSGWIGAGGSFSKGGSKNSLYGPIKEPSNSSSINYGAGGGLGGGYIIGECNTRVLSCN